METIKNYLESMFRGIPLTDKIMRAKSELLQMMEDKYTELIRSGKTENEAVGEVIQNFGNLEELANDLGITDILSKSKYSDINRRKLSFDEVTEYIAAKKKTLFMKASGIFLFINCVIFPIIADAFNFNETAGVVLMFVSVAVGVVLVGLAHSLMEQWRFITKEPCSIDSVAMDYLKNKNREFTPSYSVLHSVGILLCVLCFIPAAIFSEIGGNVMDELGGAFLFVFVGAGVFMIVYAKSLRKTYSQLIGINDQIDFTEVKYDYSTSKNPGFGNFMKIYWLLVTCFYLSTSFLTFAWHMTWIIWPIAAVVNIILKAIIFTNNTKNE